MSQLSPSFRDPHRVSNNPVPLRSPSPDFMTKSAILSTVPAQIQHRVSNKMPLNDELKFLREENNRLLQIATARGNTSSESPLNQILRDKQKLIQTLRNQLKIAQSKAGKINLSASDIRSKQSPSQLKIQNQELKDRIKKLLDENDDLKRKRSGDSAIKLRPSEPIVLPQTQDLQLTRSNLERIKQQIGRELNSSVNQMMNSFSLKLEDIERRVTSIQRKLTYGIRQYESGSKDNGSTVGNVSPGPSSNFNNTANKNDFSTPTPDDKKYSGLMSKIEQLQDQLYTSKVNEHELKIKITKMEQQVQRLRQQLTHQSLSSSKNRNSLPPLSDSKTRHLEENHSLKQSLTRLSGQLTTIKNQKSFLERQIDTLKGELENQRRNKFNIGNQNDQNSQFEEARKKLLNDNLSLKDTLSDVRRSNQRTINDLDDMKRLNEMLKQQIESLNREKSDLNSKIRVDSSADIQADTETMKLRLRVVELERVARETEFISNQLNTATQQLNSTQSQIRELKTKLFDIQNQNENYRREAQRAFKLSSQNDMLRDTIAEYQKSQQNLLKGSDHTKNQLIKTIQDKTNLQNQIIQLKSTVRMAEADLVSSRQKAFNFQKQLRKQQQINDINQLNIAKMESNLNNAAGEKEHLVHQNNILRTQFRKLEEEYYKLKNDKQKQELLNQVNILTTRLRQSEQHLTNSQRLEQQKSNELQAALFQLSQAKRILTQLNFDSIESIVKDLQSKQKIAFEQRVELNRLSQQSSQQLSRLALENDKLKKDVLEINQKFIEQKDKADRLTSSISHLQNEKLALNERINRLDETIKQYLSQDNTRDILSTFEQRQITESGYFDQRLGQRQLEQISYLKKPLNQALEKIDYVAEKITHHIEGRIERSGIIQTQSYMVPSNMGDSRR